MLQKHTTITSPTKVTISGYWVSDIVLDVYSGAQAGKAVISLINGKW